MQLICTNDEVVSTFTGQNSVRDGQVVEIRIFAIDYVLQVHVDINMRDSSDYRSIQIRCAGCKEYEFYDMDGDGFYDIERFKLIRLETGEYFISFDPYDEDEIRSDEDKYFIRCTEISFYKK